MEITVTRTREDYRAIAWDMKQTWPLVSLLSALLGFGALVALVARERVSATLFLALAVLAPVAFFVTLRRHLNQLTVEQTTSPVTFRLSEDGISMDSALERRLIKWPGLRQSTRTSVAWYFTGDTMPMVLPRRQLSPEQEVAISAAIDEHSTTPTPTTR